MRCRDATDTGDRLAGATWIVMFYDDAGRRMPDRELDAMELNPVRVELIPLGIWCRKALMRREGDVDAGFCYRFSNWW